MSLAQVTSPPQASAEIVVNRNFETLEHQGVYGQRQSAHSGLTWGYYGGRWGGFSISDGTLSLTDSSTNYAVVNISTGAISTSTATTNWNDTANYVRAYKLTTSGGVVTAVEDHRAGPGGVHGGAGGGGASTESIIIAVGDETTPITTGTAKVTFRMPYAFTLSAVRASVTTAPTGQTIIVDINESGSTIMTTNKLSIDASEKTSTTAATQPGITDSALADDAEITIDIDQVGSGTAGTGLKVTLIGTQA